MMARKMILTAKHKIWNAAFPREAEQLQSNTIKNLLKARIPGFNYYNLNKNISIEWEYPEMEMAEYRWVWLVASEKLAQAIDKTNYMLTNY